MLVALVPYISCLRQERMRFTTLAPPPLATTGMKNKALGTKEITKFISTVSELTNRIFKKTKYGPFIRRRVGYILV